MRTTQATRSVERLKARTGNPRYAAISVQGGLFYLVDRSSGTPARLCEPLPLEAFVAFVDDLGPKPTRKASKLDLAFEAQIKQRKP